MRDAVNEQGSGLHVSVHLISHPLILFSNSIFLAKDSAHDTDGGIVGKIFLRFFDRVPVSAVQAFAPRENRVRKYYQGVRYQRVLRVFRFMNIEERCHLQLPVSFTYLQGPQTLYTTYEQTSSIPTSDPPLKRSVHIWNLLYQKSVCIRIARGGKLIRCSE